MLDGYIPAVEKMRTQLKKYSTAFTSTKVENEKLKKKNKKLSESLDEATHESVLKQLKDVKLQRGVSGGSRDSGADTAGSVECLC